MVATDWHGKHGRSECEGVSRPAFQPSALSVATLVTDSSVATDRHRKRGTQEVYCESGEPLQTVSAFRVFPWLPFFSYLSVAQAVNVAGMGARNPALAFLGQVEAFAVLTHPADLFGGDADHQGVVGYVTVDDGTGTDEGVTSDGDAANDGAVRAQSRALLDQRGTVLVLARDGGSWVVDVGEDHARPAEDVVLEGDVVVHRDVVLHLDVVADLDAVADEYVLAERALLADTGAATDVHPVPDAGALAYGGAFIDDGGVVYLVVHKFAFCLPRTFTENADV